MTKEKLVAKIQTLLETDADLSFLVELKEAELERLAACIRDRLGDLEGYSTIRKGLTNQ